MARRRPLRVPSCPRCGNEEDLREWYNGIRYCESCIVCPHGREGVRGGVCTACLRRLYTVMTFEGPRIIDMDFYVAEAWREYGVYAGDLQVWSFPEEGQLGDRIADAVNGPESVMRVIAPPPHHRFG